MKRIITLFIAFLGLVQMSQAQQELMVSQYMFNGLLLNPAYAGTRDYWSATALHRSQWMKFEGAPTTQVVGIDGSIAKDRLGVGLVVNNDRIGITSALDVSANIAYHLQLTAKSTLSFGLRAGAASYSARLSELVAWDPGDNVYATGDIQGQFVPKFGFGMYWHNDRYYAGLSVPLVYSIDDAIIIDNSVTSNYFTQHYYFNAGGVFDAGANLAIKPSFLVKYHPSAPVQVDLNCNFLIYRRLWLGAGLRTGDALIGMIEYNITPQLRMGYAYDYTLSDINTYSSGSHEVMLGFDFGSDILVKKRSPRYF
ncbi:MAG: type IX secretion system membrane protein PorP/SprF [Flavobacteriales bacterium]|jgi:type IX secretion system PorP/SprF family membrane protein